MLWLAARPRRLALGPARLRVLSSSSGPLLGSICQRNAAVTPTRCITSSSHLSTEVRRSALPFVGDTIYALSTAQGRAGIAVVRVSGPSCLKVYEALCPGKRPPTPRHATVRTLLDPSAAAGETAAVLDSGALILYLPSPRTVTGEDVLELHVHGGTATVRAVLEALRRCQSTTGRPIRYAEPGEFTKRAFFNDRLDLAQVEALGDALAADTEQQRRAAVRGSSGSLGRTYEAWRHQLLLARGEIEALIDFSEDQHFDESQADLMGNVTGEIEDMLRRIQLHEQGSQRSELLRNGIRIALLGPPNVGKSSLMNLVVGREASIVSGEAGTTRDIVEASLDIRGYLCSFADTAGFRSAKSLSASEHAIGAIEEEGIRRAKQKALESDIVVALASVETGPNGPRIHYDEETLELAARAESCIVAVNKHDAVDQTILSALLQNFRQDVALKQPQMDTTSILCISCRQAQTATNGQDPGGLQALIAQLARRFAEMTDMPVELRDLLGVTERQRQLLAKCRGHLGDFMREARPEHPGADADAVLAAEHLRYAADCLARITGRGEGGDMEEVLGVVFEKFCVGK